MGNKKIESVIKNFVQMPGDQKSMVDLKDLSLGDKLFVKFGEEEKDIIDFTITKSALKNCKKIQDSAYATISDWKWDGIKKNSKGGQIKVIIGGSCKYDKDSPIGLDFLTLGKLTVGRNFVIWRDDGSNAAVIFSRTIQKITVYKPN